jgi:hypothetical protein
MIAYNMALMKGFAMQSSPACAAGLALDLWANLERHLIHLIMMSAIRMLLAIME